MDPDSTGGHWRSPAAIRPTPELSPEQWGRVKEVFHAALERPPGERRAFVHAACGDTTVASAVERLLAGDEAAQSFMATPAAALVGPQATRGISAGGRTAPRPVHDRRAHRRRGHGRGLPRPRHQTGTRRGD